MTSLTLRNLSKSFGAVDVVKGVDLDVVEGEFVVFVGPSGCGKSTLLRMIAGLEGISGGELRIGDTRMNEVDASKRGIAMVFQSYALYPHLSVRENMGFALRYAGMPAGQIAKRVADAAATLELTKLMDRKPKELSGGQRQRVAIGRAIVREPGVFLFDEPLSNLDAELRVHMRVEIAKLHKALGATIIYVTHDQVEAMTLADKIVVLRDGRIEQSGSPLKLFDDPDNLFVAGFIGSPKMNFLAGHRQGNRLVIPECGGHQIAMPDVKNLPAEGEPLTIGLRPQVIGRGGGEMLPLTIEIVEHLGTETLVHARPADSARNLIASIEGGRDLRTGQTFEAHFAADSIFLFGRDGLRLR